MTEKRYYEKKYGDEFYILDSNTISEKEFEEKLEIQGYKAFEDSLTGKEVVDLLNENKQLKKALDDFKAYDEKEFGGLRVVKEQFEVIFNGDTFCLRNKDNGELLKFTNEKACYDYVADLLNYYCDKIVELEEKYHFIQREFMKSQEEWVNSISKITEENKQLKKELWEAEVNYIEERNDNSLDIEKDMEFLKKEWKNKRWLPI